MSNEKSRTVFWEPDNSTVKIWRYHLPCDSTNLQKIELPVAKMGFVDPTTEHKGLHVPLR
jgi:hypothetical protein